MLGQELEDKRKGNGIMLAEDDLEVGQYVCVYNLKRTDEGAPIMGQSLQIKAICLPYFIGQLLSDPSEPVLTLDCRYINLMRVTKKFVQAQQAGAKQGVMQQPFISRSQRKKQQPKDG